MRTSYNSYPWGGAAAGPIRWSHARPPCGCERRHAPANFNPLVGTMFRAHLATSDAAVAYKAGRIFRGHEPGARRLAHGVLMGLAPKSG
jgi:hypothetical protein